MVLLAGAIIGLGAVLSAAGVVGDWRRWATGKETPQIVEFDENDTREDRSYYMVVQNRSAQEARLFDLQYQASRLRLPGHGQEQPVSALIAHHEYRIPIVCGSSQGMELDPNFVIEAEKSEAFRLTLVGTAKESGSECTVKLRFGSSAGATNWKEFTTFFPRPHPRVGWFTYPAAE
jgi:hypothetical protein